MKITPFLKWAGGKRWLVENSDFEIPHFPGRYIEPFLGGGAVFFHLQPERAILADINQALIDTYAALKADWRLVWTALQKHQRAHSRQYYYEERTRKHRALHQRAAQFLYLNRTCWNGLYRVNLRGEFNVPIGTKNNVLFDEDNFPHAAYSLRKVSLRACDFAETIELAEDGDLVFVDPPYTTAHNANGFLKYNQNIFCWNDQLRLKDSVFGAASRGAKIIMTNADHRSIRLLYDNFACIHDLSRPSVISGLTKGRQATSECLIII